MAISQKLESGKWIAVVQKDLMTGDSAKEAYDKAKEKYPTKEPFIMKVPDNAVMLL